MWFKFNSGAKRGIRAERGSVAVEFAIIVPVLVLLIVGAMDFGHRFYIQYLTSNASREGARYAAKYIGMVDVPTSDAIRDYVKLPAGLNYNKFNLDNFEVHGDYTAGNVIVTVSVQADKQWWILGTLLGFPNPQTVTATTAMNVER